jgi:sugar phosphate isomerase/epimerase
MTVTRRKFFQDMGALALGSLMLPDLAFASDVMPKPGKMFFEISLAQWSLHKAMFSKKITTLDFPGIAKKEFGINVVEYVNQFFMDKAKDTAFLNELLKRSTDNGVKNHLIMVDLEGALGDLNDTKRSEAVENHYKWVDAARFLGCKTIRVNAFGEGSPQDVHHAAVDGLGRLGEYASKVGLNVIVENHGGLTSNGAWLASVLKDVNKSNVGALPDFGNFCIKREGENMWEGKCIDEYDKYKGVKELMPFAKGVSAKTFDFDEKGNCVETDYYKMFKIIKDSGFKGYVGIEYEGNSLDEYSGIHKTVNLLKKVGASLS